MLTLKDFQHTAVSKLIAATRKLLANPQSKVCVFKAPTGSGKTLMMADFLRRFREAAAESAEYVFIWIAPRKLHLQSKEKLESYLYRSPYSFLTLESLTADPLPDNTILFANWEQLTNTYKNNSNVPDGEEVGNWSNVAVRNREDGRSIKAVLQRTREDRKAIILIIDEAHLHSADERNNAARFIDEVIQPRLTYEVSATPERKIEPEDLQEERAGFYSVKFDDVIAEGLIKQETVINPAIDRYEDYAGTTDEIILTAALSKRLELLRTYRESGIAVNPLLLIQLPNDSKKMSKDDERVQDGAEAFFASKDITRDNGKLAVWLSEDKSENLAGIEDNTSPVEVLLFKTAIATGWDCPRAQVLAMLRPIGSVTFEIQTVGRILRMPEGKHYEEECAELNKAFVFSNMPSITVKDDDESIPFFKTKTTRLKKGIQNVALPSIFLSRTDYGDLTQMFENILVQELNERCGITEDDFWKHTAQAKAGRFLELDPAKLKIPVLSDVVLKNIDKAAEEVNEQYLKTVNLAPSFSGVQEMFDKLTLIWSLPYAPSRSYSKIKTGLFYWFDQLGYTGRGVMQRIFACSKKNQEFAEEMIAAAQEKYKIEKGNVEKRRRKDFIFSLPPVLEFGENYEFFKAEKFAYGRCYLLKSRSEPEKKFEKKLEESASVEWWYKNGDKGTTYFAVAYEHREPAHQDAANRDANHREPPTVSAQRAFYPDYIVKYKDGRIGIFDTKKGNTVSDTVTKWKADALQRYIKGYSVSRAADCVGDLHGGIIDVRDDGFYLQNDEDYQWNDETKWKRFEM